MIGNDQRVGGIVVAAQPGWRLVVAYDNDDGTSGVEEEPIALWAQDADVPQSFWPVTRDDFCYWGSQATALQVQGDDGGIGMIGILAPGETLDTPEWKKCIAKRAKERAEERQKANKEVPRGT